MLLDATFGQLARLTFAAVVVVILVRDGRSFVLGVDKR